MAADVLPFQTARTVIRRLNLDDLPIFFNYRADPDLGRYQGWTPEPLEETRAFLLKMSTAPLFLEGEWIQLAIANRADNRLIGDIGVCLRGDHAEIGFTLERSAQGQGLATEALSVLVGHLLTRVPRVIGIADERNVASMRLLERLGMRMTGREETIFRGEDCVEIQYEIGGLP